MAEHSLPEPASLHVSMSLDLVEVRVQVHGHGLAETAGVLLAWAGSVAAVRFRVWRARESSVHLDVDTTLSSAGDAVRLTVYGGVDFDPATFAGLAVDQTRPVSLGQFTAWTTSTSGAAA
jgi:hypothetical protein